MSLSLAAGYGIEPSVPGDAVNPSLGAWARRPWLARPGNAGFNPIPYITARKLGLTFE